VGEETTVKAYSDSLNETVELGLKQGFAKGLAIGSIGVNFAIWAFLAWYGSQQVLKGYANGAQVLITGVSVLVGGMYVTIKLTVYKTSFQYLGSLSTSLL